MAVVAVCGLSVTGDRTAATSTATISAKRNVTALSELHGGGCSATTAATPGGAVKVETLDAERATPPAATPGSARYDGETTSGGPWPREGTAFGDAPQACLGHVVEPDVSPWSPAAERMWPDVTYEKSATN